MSRKLVVEKVSVKGKEFEYKYLHTKSAVVVLPVLPENKIVLVKQHRLPVKNTVLELPAGGLEEGEEPEQAALRELQEETGYCADEIQFLTKVYSSPGITNESLYIYLAKVSKQDKQELDDIEEIEIEVYNLEAVLEMIQKQQIIDAKTILGVFWYNNLR